ncbi:MAG: hypothetical protein R3D98_01375 [Candidatus Krumholzibacteriia bacterium]
MELRELRIQQLPGIAGPFTLTGAAGLNLVLGPNGSGKSSLCRAALGLLWPDRHAGGLVSARWSDGPTVWLAERAGGNRVTWQKDGLPADPPGLPSSVQAGAFHLGVLDLLKPAADRDDQALAQAVRRQLAGGFDLPALLAGEVVSGKEGHAEKRRFEAAQQSVQRWRQTRRDLADDEARLDDLRPRRQAAHIASEHARALAAALALVEARGHAESVAHELTTRFPAAMAELRPEHLERLVDLRSRQRRIADDLVEQRRRHDAAAAAVAATGLAGRVPEPATLDAVRDALARARELTQDLADLSTQIDAAAGALTAAAADLAPWADAEPESALSPAALRAAARLAGEIVAATAEREGLQRLHDHEDLQASAPVTPSRESLLAGRRAALDWLAAGHERRWSWPALLGGAALATVGVLARPWSDGTLGWLWLGLGGGLLVWFAIDGWRRPATRRALDDHRAAGIEAPPRWRDAVVRRQIDHLIQQELALGHHERREALRHRLAADREEVDAKLAALLAADRAPAGGHVAGVDPERRIEMVEMLERSAEHRRARQRHTELTSRQDGLEAELARLLDTVAVALAPWPDDRGGATTPTLTQLRARHQDLARRAEAHDAAARDLAAAAQRTDDLQAAAADVEREIARLLSAQDLPAGGDEDLRRRVADLPAYTSLAAAARDAATAARLREEELEQLPDATRDAARDASRRPAADLRRDLDETGDIAETHDGLHREIVRIEARLEAARNEVEFDRTISARDEARDQLAAVREQVRDAALRRLLIERLQREHRRLAEPPVVARARQLLLRFTHGTHELLIPADDESVFRARDTRSDRGLDLAQLSDGTRAQLLLASRLAYLAEAERGVTLPLFLDEALTASDPVRFAAVADALLDLVERDGRQLFYFTCDPADVRAWQQALADRGRAPAPVTDLAELRRLASAGTAARFRGDRLLPPPAAAGEDAADYATRLRVPGLDPHIAAGGAHLFHVLRDDLALLHALLCRGLSHVGQLDPLADVLVAEGVVQPERLAALRARARALQIFLEAFATGRGRPLPTGELERHSGINTKLLPEVDMLAAELAGDASRLVDALASGRIKRLREDKQDELTAWLRQAGYLDQRTRMTRDEVATLVLRSVREEVGQGHVDVAVLRQLIDSWWTAAGGEAD